MEIKSTKVAYECPILKVEEREVIVNGKEKTFWVVVRSPNVNVVALTKDKKLVLIKEILGQDGKECLLLPGGKVESYEFTQEDVKNQALQELQEEAGYSSTNIELLSIRKSPWNTFERQFFTYVVWDATPVGQDLEGGEMITPLLLSKEEANNVIVNRKMTSAEEERIFEHAIKWFEEKKLL